MLRLCLLLDTVALFVGIYGFMSGQIPITTPTILTTVFGFIGINMLIGGLYSYQQTRSWLSRTSETFGEVVGYECRTSYDTDKNRTRVYYHPTVRFQAQTGQMITFTSSVGSSQRGRAVGESLSVVYLPSNPQDAQVNEFIGIWLVPIVLFGIGSPMLLVALGLAFSHINV